MKIKDFDGGYIDVNIIVTRYAYYDNLRISFETADTHEAYSIITTNIKKLPYNQAAIDVNNHPEAPELIESQNLGFNTGKSIRSGFCVYPIYEFYMDKLPEPEDEDDLADIMD